ncbi:MAG: DNA primase [Candidatus Rokubacteria bacterium]|nr:DNA primase [Candidatus Rokubacteria bacterium]
MASYPPALLDEIRGATDIVELVGRFVNLRKAGATWKGLCPFHGEKTPSFIVNPRRGIFKCFGCGVGGDAFGFLMRQDKLSFPEAVRALARSANVALPDERRDPADSGREELYRVMDLAARFYAETLWKPASARAREYLETRGIDPEVARRFSLGFAPEGWEALLGFMRAERVGAETLETVGLVKPRERGGGHYDAFRGRLIFTIRDLQGRVVAFGGRGLGDEQPKYLNSPETPLYTKGNLLYAADLARTTIRAKNRALLVEGYVDCLMAHQHGFTETVAALGTAFTPAQLGTLRRYCEEVITFFDADAAGAKAAERAADLLEPTGAGAAWGINRSGDFGGEATFRLKVALLPAGHDPDTFLRTQGAAGFEERIAGARSLLAYALDRAISDPDGATGPRARANAFARVALMLAKVADAEEAATLSREAAVKLGVDPTQLWIEAQKLQGALGRPHPGRPAAPAAAPGPAAGAPEGLDLRLLVEVIVQRSDARQALVPLLEDGDILGEPFRTIVRRLREQPEAAPEALMADLDEAGRTALAALLVNEREFQNVDGYVADFRQRIERMQRRRRIREASRGIVAAQAGGATPDPEKMAALLRDGKEEHEVSKTLG